MKGAEVREIAALIDSKLLATDKRFNRSVTVIHQEGTVFHYQNAFLMTYKEWIMIFPEHHAPQCLMKEDLEFYRQYEDVKVQEYRIRKKK